MKENTRPRDIIMALLGLLSLLLIFLYLLVATPFDYLKYKMSRYYKDTREKYSCMCASSYYITFYDMIKKENLPIEYYRSKSDVSITGYGFFVYNDTLILGDYDLCFNEENHVWEVEVKDEYVDVEAEVERDIHRCNELLGNEICKKAVLLIDEDLYNKHPDVKYENIELLPTIGEKYTAAIRALIE